MAELIIGAAAATGFLALTRVAQTRGLSVSWWQWGLTLLGFLYGVFVLEVMVSFLREGTPKGAAVMGTILGFVAVVWGVLLSRFVFRARKEAATGETVSAGGGDHV
jgi:hypothetical protein